MATSEEQNPMIAPGGPRAPETMQHVSPGQSVLETPAGSFVTNADSAQQPAKDAMVITPGGERLRSLVHHIEPGASVDGKDFHLRSIHANGNVLQSFGKLEPRPADKPLMPGNVNLEGEASPVKVTPATDAPVIPAFGTGWITFASWTNSTGTPITSFTTTWEVPPAPIARSVPAGARHIIFLFNGIQNSTMIYQPVLQWGNNGEGGGDFWTVASWYADGQGGPAFHSNWVRVNPGQIVTGLITQTAHTGSAFSYNCEFVGIANTSLPITNVQELTFCIETLECYGITGATAYPPTFRTPMKNIAIKTGATSPALVWTPSDSVQDCGQHTTVVSNANPNGEVDLCYGSVAPPSAAVVSWSDNRLDIFGLGLDDQCYQKSWDGHAWQGWTPLGGVFNSPIAAVSWARNRIDLFGLGRDNQCYHKAWTGSAWSVGWQAIGGVFDSPLAVVSRDEGILDVFGLGTDNQCYHKWFDGTNWGPSTTGWEALGGVFNSPLTAVSWGANRLDIFGLGTDNQCYHKWWSSAHGWGPSPTGWEAIGGVFNSPISAVCYAPDRIDLFGLGLDNSMFHKWYDQGWGVSQTFWEGFGGKFRTPLTAVSWGKNRLDVFGLGTDNALYHKTWQQQGWQPATFDRLGGTFNSNPAAACWGADRIDLFGLGTNNSMFHKAWTGSNWGPTGIGWEDIGGLFDPA